MQRCSWALVPRNSVLAAQMANGLSDGIVVGPLLCCALLQVCFCVVHILTECHADSALWPTWAMHLHGPLEFGLAHVFEHKQICRCQKGQSQRLPLKEISSRTPGRSGPNTYIQLTIKQLAPRILNFTPTPFATALTAYEAGRLLLDRQLPTLAISNGNATF